jgi:hypothetical protein
MYTIANGVDIKRETRSAVAQPGFQFVDGSRKLRDPRKLRRFLLFSLKTRDINDMKSKPFLKTATEQDWHLISLWRRTVEKFPYKKQSTLTLLLEVLPMAN